MKSNQVRCPRRVSSIKDLAYHDPIQCRAGEWADGADLGPALACLSYHSRRSETLTMEIDHGRDYDNSFNECQMDVLLVNVYL